MTRESLEELRERLLRQENVQQMIQVRAYEIYRMRGGKPGGEGQDWFHAEGEVLAFLIARESAREDEQVQTETVVAAPASQAPLETPPTKKPRTRASEKPPASREPVTKKTAAKPTAPRKSADSKSKSKRTSNQPKKEESVE